MLLGPSVYLKPLGNIPLFLYANLFLISKSTTNWTTLPRLAASMIRSLYTSDHSSSSFCMLFLVKTKQNKNFPVYLFYTKRKHFNLSLRQVRALSEWCLSSEFPLTQCKAKGSMDIIFYNGILFLAHGL